MLYINPLFFLSIHFLNISFFSINPWSFLYFYFIWWRWITEKMANCKQNQTDTFDREFDQARLKTWPPVKLVRTDICHQQRYLCRSRNVNKNISPPAIAENLNIFLELRKTLIAAFIELSWFISFRFQKWKYSQETNGMYRWHPGININGIQ